MLKYVTLTGADDSVTDQDEMFRLSEEFPFVEWGILVASSTGHRFPSLDWIKALVEKNVKRDVRMNLSLHICGMRLREIMAGRSTLLDTYTGFAAFQRCQLNFHGDRCGDVGEQILRAFCFMEPWEPQIIFQFDRVNESLINAAGRRFPVAALFDESHGAGQLPEEWRQSLPDYPCGYAGGLGPQNVAAELSRIIPKTYPAQGFWIDMETRLYTDGKFDLGKCRSVLEQAAPFVEATA